MRRITLAISLVLVMVLCFTACEKEPSAQEIVDGVIKSMDEIKSHKYDVGVSLGMAGEAEGEAVELTMEFDLSGAMGIENKQINLAITGSVLFPGEDETEISLEIYIIDDVSYILTEIPGEGPMWLKETGFSETDWKEFIKILGFAERQVELLQASDISVIGSEKIKGVDCYVLQLTPDDMELLWEVALEETDPLDMGVPAIAEEVLRDAFTSFSVKQWVTKDTYFLTKSEIYISMEMTPEVIDAIGGDEFADMKTTKIDGNWLFYDYDQPITIELPPEAEEAIEIPME